MGASSDAIEAELDAEQQERLVGEVTLVPDGKGNMIAIRGHDPNATEAVNQLSIIEEDSMYPEHWNITTTPSEDDERDVAFANVWRRVAPQLDSELEMKRIRAFSPSAIANAPTFELADDWLAGRTMKALFATSKPGTVVYGTRDGDATPIPGNGPKRRFYVFTEFNPESTQLGHIFVIARPSLAFVPEQ